MQLDERSSLLLAALALPGLAASLSHAETAPENSIVQFSYSHYKDRQPGADRMEIKSPSLYVLRPLGESYSLEAALVYDAMSGASPYYHDTLSGASGTGIHDERKAGDFKFTRYFARSSVTVGIGYSDEHDYRSKSANLSGKWSTDDNNTTLSLGVGLARDAINSTNGVAVDEKKRVDDINLGLSRVLSPVWIVQANLGYARGRGYFSDPYKPLDTRPTTRNSTTLLFRSNYFVEPADAVLRTSYRYFTDTWGVRAHTLEATWDQAIPAAWATGWRVAPALRYYSQSKARFYFPPPFGEGFVPDAPYSADNRLGTFGALTAGVTVSKDLGNGIKLDVQAEKYRQEAGWAVRNRDGAVSPFSALALRIGVRYLF